MSEFPLEITTSRESDVSLEWHWEPFQLRKQLDPASSQETYNLHLAAIEYGLATSIAIQGPEDLKSRHKPPQPLLAFG